MVEDFILYYSKLIVKYPNSLKIEVKSVDEVLDEIVLFADAEDVGKLIGKEGKMINAIKTLISGCKAKGSKNYRVSIKAI
jgi:predicted RNA-binding protein YlqC (UPF0109 family)